MACPSCDWLHIKEELNPREKAKCARCHEVMYTHRPNTVDKTLAASLASIIFLLVSLFLPFLTLKRSGVDSSISLMDAAWSLIFSEVALLGLFVLLLIVLIPLLRFGLIVYVLSYLKFGGKPTVNVKRSFRFALVLEPWAMADVFLIGVVVSLIKISQLAVLFIGPAFWAWVALIITSIFISINFSRETMWLRLNLQ